MNILLINPPRSPHNGILAHATDRTRRYIHKKLVGPPLGLLTIAAAVRKDHTVALLDMKGEYDLHPDAPPPGELARTWCEKTAPRIVGVTAISSEWPAAVRILRAIKEVDPDIITVAGGLHVTLCPDDMAAEGVDIALPGMAAAQFRAVVAAVERNRPLKDIPGVLLHESGRLLATAPPEPVDPADRDFIMPDRTFLRPWHETYRVGNGQGPVTYLFTSLGCPCSCTFCSIWPLFDGKYLQRRVESVVDELKTLDEYPVVRFADANTIVQPDFIGALFDRILEEGIRKEYVMDLRFDTVVRYPALIEKLARAGLRVVICGFESFRQEELDRFRKSASAALIADAVNIFDRNGIMVRGNYVISPDYTRDDFDAITAYAASHRVVYAGYTILTPMPGTSLHAEMRGEIIDHDLEKYNFFNCVLKTALPPDEFYRRVADLWMIKKGEEVI